MSLRRKSDIINHKSQNIRRSKVHIQDRNASFTGNNF